MGILRAVLSFEAICLSFVAICLAAPSAASPQVYLLEPDGSRASFSYQLGVIEARGRVEVEAARFVVDFDAVAHSGVEVVLNMRSARAGDLFSTRALKSGAVLDTRGFPSASFTSRRVERREEGFAVIGDLTLRGVTREVTLEAHLIRPPDAPEDNSRLFMQVTGAISRAAFGARGFGGLVGDRIGLDILVQLTRQ